MFKKAYFSIAIALLSLTSFAHSTTLEHLDNAKNDIIFELNLALTLLKRSEEHFSAFFADQYPSVKQACLQLLSSIVSSPEFATTLAKVTDEQLILIVEHMIDYNDIIIDPSAYPLEQKVNDALANAAFDEPTNQLFNVLYVAYAIARGSRILLEKLEIARKKLVTDLERASLPAADQAIQA